MGICGVPHVTTGATENFEREMDVPLGRVLQLSKGISVATGLGERKKKKKARGRIRYSPLMRTTYKDPNRHAIEISERKKNNRHHSRLQ